MKRWRMAAVLVVGMMSVGWAKDTGQVQIPWPDLVERLGLDGDRVTIPMADYLKLLRQTGVPAAALPADTGGRVTLTRAEMQALLARLVEPADPGAAFFLTKAVYTGRIGRDKTRVHARLDLRIDSSAVRGGPVRLPVFPAGVAFEDVRLDGRAASIENDGSQLWLTTRSAGDHVVDVVFALPVSLKRNARSLTFPAPATPITEIDLVIAQKGLDVQADGAPVERIEDPAGTRARAVLPRESSVEISWTPAVPEREKGPAKLYADVLNLLSVEDDAVRVTSRVQLDVLQNTVSAVSLTVPSGYSVLSVSGDGIGDWKADDRGALSVPFLFPVKGSLALTVSLERLSAEKTAAVRFDGLHVAGAVRERGSLGVELKTSGEVRFADAAGLDRIDTKELPPALAGLAERPLLFAFRFLKPDYGITLDIEKHEELPVISSVIDQASGVTLILNDGRRVHQVTYWMRNSWEQFLSVSLPRGSQLWSAFVDGQAVKPSSDGKGRVLIPLIRSRADGAALAPFTIELVYFEDGAAGSILGAPKVELPSVDVLTSQLVWALYWPESRRPLWFGGSLDADAASPVIDTLKAAHRRVAFQAGQVRLDAPKAKAEMSDALELDEKAANRQVDSEESLLSSVAKDKRDAGVLPVRISVPLEGRVYRFGKKIVTGRESLFVRAVFVSDAVVRWLALVVLAAAVALGFRKRDALRRALERSASSLGRGAMRLRRASPAALFGAGLTAAFIGGFVSPLVWIVGLALAAAGAGRWYLRHRRDVIAGR